MIYAVISMKIKWYYKTNLNSQKGTETKIHLRERK